MKFTRQFFITFICLNTFTNFECGLAMDTISCTQMTHASKDTQTGTVILLDEVITYIRNLLSAATYLQAAKLMKFRRVCKLWNDSLTNDFIKQRMAMHLIPLEQTNYDDYITKLAQAIAGRGLGSRVAEFCLCKLWSYPNPSIKREAFCRALTAVFCRKKRKNEISYNNIDRKLIIDYKLMKVLRNIFAHVSSHVFMYFNIQHIPDYRHTATSVLDLCLNARYTKAEYKDELLLLLRSRGLDISDQIILGSANITLSEPY